jgi:flagellar assembly protein FliH
MNSLSENVNQSVQAFDFPPVASVVVSSGIEGPLWVSSTEGARGPVISLRDAEERAEKARIEGRSQGELQARRIFEEEIAEQREAVASAIADFSAERASYFERVEAEVVQLALSVARKILHREAQVDPMLLASLVRASLSELNQTSNVVLHVSPAAVQEWQAYFATSVGRKPAPRVVGDPAMANARCMIQSDVGTTEINVESQLAEIERGFFDLLAERPRNARLSASEAVQ